MSDLIKRYYPLFPMIGLGCYLLLFFIAASKFPGGSMNIQNSEGFDYFHNFLCDLTLPITENGQINPGRSLAIWGHLFLSFGMISFFYILPEIFTESSWNTWLTRWVGILTMSVFLFMFTEQHDIIVTVTGVLGCIALVPFFIELKSFQNKGLKILAYACFVGSIIVFISFETKIGFYYLPFFQKIVFLLDAWWVVWVSILVFATKRDMKLSPSI